MSNPKDAPPVLPELSERYHRWVAEHPRIAHDVAADVEDLLVDAGVTFDAVTARVKTWPSFLAKAQLRREDGSLVYPDPWENIHDRVGVRVTVYHSTEIPRAIAVLRHSFRVIKDVDKTEETRISGGFGYGSHHLVVEVPSNTPDLGAYTGLCFEVQVRTVLQHAWAEFEHDIRYKRGEQELDPQVDRAFTLAAGLIELADQQFDQIATIRSGVDNPAEDVDIQAETLPGVLAVYLGNDFPLSRVEHYRWLEQLLRAHGITQVKQLRSLTDRAEVRTLLHAMTYRFRPSQVRIVDDLLLLRYGESHVERTGNTGKRPDQRPERLRRRLEQLRAAGLSPGESRADGEVG
ncbi:GTP pyrophosphokinase family protein [Corynebacterium uropygiale]|uniref:GTP pyrophosphokinase family protein n=1 Tax=Corynebacterium uropygiale TaxID=1775911 RepID=A0A9X1QRN8_9CORY|nr:GTP pyrophosphokinase family protein [Corynebacterium uropygiale]MCF4006314.1 GTP pyrophosphokinase family protein [Corynebacterium uropygiale]